MSDRYEVIISPTALDDLLNIYSYISVKLKSEQSANALLNWIRESISGLDVFPERFPVVDWEPWRSEEMHRFPIGNYVVFYRVDPSESTVEVIRVFYGRQDIRGASAPPTASDCSLV